MIRFISAVFALSFAGSAFAADQPTSPDLPRIVMVIVQKDFLMWNEVKRVPVAREVDVQVVRDGRAFTETRPVTTYETIAERHAVPVKGLKAVDGTGKAIGADQLAELLAEDKAVVFHSGPLPAKYRKLFRDDAILIEFAAK